MTMDKQTYFLWVEWKLTFLHVSQVVSVSFIRESLTKNECDNNKKMSVIIIIFLFLNNSYFWTIKPNLVLMLIACILFYVRFIYKTRHNFFLFLHPPASLYTSLSICLISVNHTEQNSYVNLTFKNKIDY